MPHRRPIAIAVLVVALATGCGQAGGSATASAAPSTGASATATAVADGTPLTVKDFAIIPADLKVPEGNLVLTVTNAGPTIHNVTIRDASASVIMATKDLKEGEVETISAELHAGNYVFFCSLPGHESLGTKATLEVGS